MDGLTYKSTELCNHFCQRVLKWFYLQYNNEPCQTLILIYQYLEADYRSVDQSSNAEKSEDQFTIRKLCKDAFKLFIKQTM